MENIAGLILNFIVILEFVGNILAVPIKKNEQIYQFRTRCHCLRTWRRESSDVIDVGDLATGQIYTRPKKVIIAPRAMMYRERKYMHPILEPFIKTEELLKMRPYTLEVTQKNTTKTKNSEDPGGKDEENVEPETGSRSGDDSKKKDDKTKDKKDDEKKDKKDDEKKDKKDEEKKDKKDNKNKDKSTE